MPKYFFDVQDGDGVFIDDAGMELPDMDTAIREARRALADMMRDALRDQSGQAVVIRIRDGAEGPVILSVSLTTELPKAERRTSRAEDQAGKLLKAPERSASGSRWARLCSRHADRMVVQGGCPTAGEYGRQLHYLSSQRERRIRLPQLLIDR